MEEIKPAQKQAAQQLNSGAVELWRMEIDETSSVEHFESSAVVQFFYYFFFFLVPFSLQFNPECPRSQKTRNREATGTGENIELLWIRLFVGSLKLNVFSILLQYLFFFRIISQYRTQSRTARERDIPERHRTSTILQPVIGLHSDRGGRFCRRGSHRVT